MENLIFHYNDVIMGDIASQITSLTIVYSTVYWSKKTPKLRVTGLCAGNSPVTGEFPAQMASSAENVSLWWRHHERFFKPNKKPYFICPCVSTGAERRRDTTWKNAHVLSIGPLGTNLIEGSTKRQWLSFKKPNLKMPPAKCRSFCLDPYVLITNMLIRHTHM